MATKAIISLFPNIDDAYERALLLTQQGVPQKNISFLAGPSAQKYAAEIAQPHNEEDRTISGVTGGAVLGGLAGAALSLVLLAIPGLGPLFVGGPLYALFYGVTGGSVTGGLIGAFARWGLIDEEAKQYSDHINQGGALMMVQTDDENADQVLVIVNANRSNPLTKIVTWDELAVAHSHQTTPAGITEPQPTKGDAILRAGNLPGMPTVESLTETFRQHFQENFASTGQPFEYYLRAYQYGYNLANDDRYRNGEWTSVEPSLRAYWEQNEPDTWSGIREAVHFGRDLSLQSANTISR